MFNAYELLGIKPNSTSATIKRAYKKKALLYHPDKNKENDTKAFLELQTYYKILRNDNSRLKYDNLLLTWNQIKMDMDDSSPIQISRVFDITLEEIYKGCEKIFTIDGNDIIVNIPKGYNYCNYFISNINNNTYIIILHEIYNKNYKRYLINDLIITINLEFIQLYEGYKAEIITLDNRKLLINYTSKDLEYSLNHRIIGEGMPYIDEEQNERKGDLYIQFVLIQPKSINKNNMYELLQKDQKSFKYSCFW